MAKLRVGIVNYLNSRPLAWSFLQNRYTDLIDSIYLPPAAVAERLAQGELEVGLLPSIEVQRIPDLEVLPGLCIAATHEARSVLLVSKTPFEAVRAVALDRNSRSSAALVRILLRDRFGIDPVFTEARPDLEAMLTDADAALLIGDPALRVDPEAFRTLDLAAEWRAVTGRPFVFALWAVRPGVDAPDLGTLFRRSLEEGMADLDAVVESAAGEQGLERAIVREYLTRNLSYVLGEQELQGLEEFFRRAKLHGLLSTVNPLQFWS